MAKKVELKVGDTVILPFTNGKTGVIVKEDVVKVVRFLIEKPDGSRVWNTEKSLVQNQDDDDDDADEDFDNAQAAANP
jgi:hypothetical protein